MVAVSACIVQTILMAAIAGIINQKELRILQRVRREVVGNMAQCAFDIPVLGGSMLFPVTNLLVARQTFRRLLRLHPGPGASERMHERTQHRED
jgi:hypothetical protein